MDYDAPAGFGTTAQQEAVARFHQAFGSPVADHPAPLTPERQSLRLSLIREEGVMELSRSLVPLKSADTHDSVLFAAALTADALIDTAYVLLGTAVELGIDVSFAANAPVHPATDSFNSSRFAAKAYDAFIMILDNLPVLEQRLKDPDPEEAATPIENMLYAIVQAFARSGLQFRDFFSIVQYSNMTKLGEDGKPVISRGEDLDNAPKGKILKGPNFQAPDEFITLALQMHGAGQ